MEVRTDVPESLGATVAGLLEREPMARPATGAAVVAALHASPVVEKGQPRADTVSTNSIAVLPFENMSPDAENAFFSDGLTEEIITDLSRVRALRVTSRTSSMHHKSSAKGSREISRALGVRYLLTGSVRRAGSALRISAQLIDATEDRQLWGEKFSGSIDDVFDLQERVSREIVATLGVTLQPDEDRRLAWMSGERWRALIDRAVDIEGETPILRGLRLWGEVMQLKGGIGDQSRLGDIEKEAGALIDAAPDAPWGYAGLLEEAADVAAELHASDPLASLSAVAGTMVPIFSGRIADTIAPLERVLATEPQNFGALWSIWYAHTITGDLDGAQRDADVMMAMAPEAPYVVQADALLRVVKGDRDGGVARVEGRDLAPFDAHLTFHIAEVFAMAGDIERGLDVLAAAVEKGFTPVAFIATHCPFIEPLRGDTRFAAILADAAARSEGVRKSV